MTILLVVDVNTIVLSFGTFVWGVYNLSFGGKHNFCTPSQGTKKSTFKVKKINSKMPMLTTHTELNSFPSISFLKGDVFSIFCQKRYGPHPSEMDIKVIIYAPTFYLLLQATL